MWLHVPSTFCPSAPESEGLNSESGSPNLGRELFAMSNLKLTPRPFSWLGWRTRPWIRLLSGTISRPSTAARGVESWIASLADTRASRSPSQASAGEPRIQGTCGPMSPGLSERCRLAFASSRMCPTTSTSDSRAYARIFGEWATELKRGYSARRKSAPHISGSASSLWPTATAQDSRASGASGYQTETRHAGTTLTDAAVRHWPTPASRDHKGGADWRKRTRDGKPRPYSDRTLPDVAEFWPTPSASSYGSNQGGSAGRVGRIRPSLQTLATRRGGRRCRMMLNPRFVEILMGFPPGWTDCGASAMQSYLKWLRLHGVHCEENSETDNGH